MAKFARRTTALAPRAPIIVMAAPRRGGGRLRRAGARAVARVRHVGGYARKNAGRSAPTMGIALGAVAVGYLQGAGFLDKLPQIGGSATTTLGILGYAATRFVKNPMVRNAGLAALAAACFDFGRKQSGGASGLDDGETVDNGTGY